MCESGKGVYLLFFLSRSPNNVTIDFEKSSCAQKIICPLPTSIVVYLVKDSTPSCNPSDSNSQFLLNLWHENPNPPTHTFYYFADFDPAEHKLRGLLFPCSYIPVDSSFSLCLYIRLLKVYVPQLIKCLTSCLNTTLNRNSLLSRGLILEQPQLLVQQALFFPSEPSFI